MLTTGQLADAVAPLLDIDQITARAFASRLVVQGWLPRGLSLLGAPATDRTAATLLTAFLLAPTSAEIDAAMRTAARLATIAAFDIDSVNGQLVDTQYPVGLYYPGMKPGMPFINDLESLIRQQRPNSGEDLYYHPEWIGVSRRDGRLFAWFTAKPVDDGADLSPIGMAYGQGTAVTEPVKGELAAEILSITTGRIIEQVAALMAAPEMPAQPTTLAIVAGGREDDQPCLSA